MPLLYLLYRCPRCGHDPRKGSGDEARCPACGTRFARGGKGGRLRVREKEGSGWEVPSHRLSAAVDAWNEGAVGEEDGGVGAGSGRITRRARVEVQQAARRGPCCFGGELLGFVESLGAPREGVLAISSRGAQPLARREQGDSVMPRTVPGRWALLDIRAVQTSSSSLQISPKGGGVVQFRFQGDSPRRWEDLLRRALREAYRKAGRGEILEFQPRIVTR